jgi:hemolysin D
MNISKDNANLSTQTISLEQNFNKQNIRILIADDQDIIRQILRISLECESGLEVVGFADEGQTAINQVERLHPDIVLMDIKMPGIDGLSATEIISQRFPNINVLILSNYDREEYIIDALKVGAKGYLLKTTPVEELIHAIRYVEKGYLQLGPEFFNRLKTETSTITQSSATAEKTSTPALPTQVAVQTQARSDRTNSESQRTFSVPPTVIQGENAHPSMALTTSSGEDRDWSSLTKELVDTMPKTWTRGILYFLATFLAFVIPWSMLSKVDETGSARGRLEPKGQTIRLDAPVAGTVTTIKVKEGQPVRAGQTLIELDSQVLRADLSEAKSRASGFSSQLKNLQLIKTQLTRNIKTQQQQNQASASEQSELIAQTQQRIDFYQTQIESAGKLVARDNLVVERYRKFQKQGVISGSQLDDVERRLIENSQNLEQAQSDKTQQQTELSKQRNAYERVIRQGELALTETNRQLKEVESQIINTRSEILQTRDRIKSLKYQIKQSQIKSPSNGTVFQLAVGHPGAVVQPSQTVTQIAPEGVPLVLKAQMPTQESGFLQVGMPVKVKFDAYPFQDYGVVEGQVSWISPDSKAGQQEQNQQQNQQQSPQQVESFELEITLNSTSIQTKNKTITLKPGQTATAEVIVRQRRLIDFVLDPFKKLQEGGLEL